MTANLTRLLLQLSESGEPAILWGRQAKPYFGKDFERLLNCRLLVEEARAEEWDVCVACECHHGVRVIQEINGRFIAACPVDQRGDSVLDPEDMRSFRIAMPALVREIATASGFAQEPIQVVPGVWHLGETAAERSVFLALSRLEMLGDGLIGTLRLADRMARISLIAPAVTAASRIRFAEADIAIVQSDECIGADGGAHPFAIDLAKLEPPSQSKPRLVVRRSARSVTLDGEPKTLTEQSFKLLVFLAERALRSPAIVDNRDIEDHLWSSTIHLISSQAREPVRALRNALDAGGADDEAAKALIENKRNPNGYRLALEPREIDLRD